MPCMLLTDQVLMANLASDPNMTLHSACADAYNK